MSAYLRIGSSHEMHFARYRLFFVLIVVNVAWAIGNPPSEKNVPGSGSGRSFRSRLFNRERSSVDNCPDMCGAQPR